MKARDRNILYLLFFGVIPVGVLLYFYSGIIVDIINESFGFNIDLNNILEIYTLLWFSSLLVIYNYGKYKE
ncbi:hypothetical protein GCM10011352_35600 [Marinobacterium zhoushanense]|uniref:Uncharacterized protein n=1 Tax=Marinobacterium zhoushanense TaxID=1679163 RepID=A0ABQ1KSM9_9GAMM|nr:hypothetical protein GCM10011352_35600 [Marinobacterium zhoushanense]